MSFIDDDPYTVCDGPWGGFGSHPKWIVFPNIHSKNVFHRAYNNPFWEFVRCWDVEMKVWREITPNERYMLPLKTIHPTLEEMQLSRKAYFSR